MKSCLDFRVEDSCTGQTLKETGIGLEDSRSSAGCFRSAGT